MFDFTAEFEAALASGNWALALPLIYLVGLGTAFTPCVYPMIAITVSVFGARQAKTRVEGALLSLAFVLGIAALFTPLGVFAAMTHMLFGEWSGSPFVVFPMAILFLALAASMFGAWDLNLPPALQNRLAQVGGAGYGGAFMLGMANGLIAAPCVGPAFLMLLGYISDSGDVVFGALGTFCYAIGLGTLFFFVGTFATSLPKGGAWMESVKSVFGIVMCVVAIYYIRTFIGLDDLFTHEWMVLAISLALVVIGLAIGAVHLDFHEPDTGKRVRKGSGIALTVAGLVGCIGWLTAVDHSTAIEGGLVWREDFATAIAEARESGRPYIVDFGADWCIACGELERDTFTHPEVMQEGGRFVAVHVDMSPSVITDEKRALQGTYTSGRALPLVVIHDSTGAEAHRVTQFVEPEEFLSLLRDVH